MNITEIRDQFPILSKRVYGRPLVYLDNAATSQRPVSVIEKWGEMTVDCNANIHRAMHKLATDATEEYESTRAFVAEYLNAASPSEIIFTSGTTASINLLAFSFGERFVSEGDEIIVAQCEHHSDIVPWQMMCQRKGATIKVLPVDQRGYLRIDILRSLITDKTRLVCVAQISNVLGIINPIKQITAICHAAGVPVLVDGAQGVVHCDVDVQDLDCDFYAFSGHKIYAATGTGVLYGKKSLLDQLPPYMGGGEMIASVSFEGTTYAPVPGRFEAGTQNIAGVPTLKPALSMASAMRCEELEENLSQISSYVLGALSSISGLVLFGDPVDRRDKCPLFSFAVRGVHHEDMALILDKMGVAVRSGQMCAEPLMDRFGVTGMLRASFAPYNTLEEAHIFVDSLQRAIKMLA